MPTHTIDVLIDDEYRGHVPAASLRDVVTEALAQQRVQTASELAVVITGDEALRELNRRHRDLDTPTDVLAFPNMPRGSFVEAPDQPRHLGDIVISYPQAKMQAARLSHQVVAELQLLVAHGVLHLLGYDDTVESKRTRMWAAQEAIIAALSVDVSLPD